MQQDSVTKEVFREMDGFLSLMSVLASLGVKESGALHNDEGVIVTQKEAESSIPSLVEPAVQMREDRTECLKLVFIVLGEAMEGSDENELYFRVRVVMLCLRNILILAFFQTKVGYESLKLALQNLATETDNEHIFSFLLALSLSDFSSFYIGFFVQIQGADEKVQNVSGTLKHSGSVKILWELAEDTSDATIRYTLFKLFEVLFTLSHRNAGILSSLGIVGSVFRRLRIAQDREKQVLQKLLRRLLEMGASTREARSLFEAAVYEEKLDPDILDVIRFGMKSRWVEHFSMESSAALVLQSDAKTLPKEGISFSVLLFYLVFSLLVFMIDSRCGFSPQAFPPLRHIPCSRLQRRVRLDRCSNFRFVPMGKSR